MFNFSSLAWGVFFERVRKCAVRDIWGSVSELSFVKWILWTKTPTFHTCRRVLSVDPHRGVDWDGWGPAEPSVNTCKTPLSVVKYIKPAEFWTLKQTRVISITRVTRHLASYQVISVRPACTCALSYHWEWNFTSTQLLWQPSAERWRSLHCAGLNRAYEEVESCCITSCFCCPRLLDGVYAWAHTHTHTRTHYPALSLRNSEEEQGLLVRVISFFMVRHSWQHGKSLHPQPRPENTPQRCQVHVWKTTKWKGVTRNHQSHGAELKWPVSVQ